MPAAILRYLQQHSGKKCPATEFSLQFLRVWLWFQRAQPPWAMHYSEETPGFVSVSAYYVLTRNCRFLFYVYLLINHKSLDSPMLKLLREKLPFSNFSARENVGGFSTTLICAFLICCDFKQHR